MFVDPASISSGWAYFDGATLVNHGTIAVPKALDPFERLRLVNEAYIKLAAYLPDVSEVHIEQLVRNTHIFTHYSVSAIGIAFASPKCKVAGDIPIQSWQAHVDWKGKRTALETYKVSSEDEQAAIGMGLYYIDNAF